MRMHNPLPPGEIINELGLEPLGLMVTEAVKETVCARIVMPFEWLWRSP
jgi:plasmid maintenance system antidote protein VapI